MIHHVYVYGSLSPSPLPPLPLPYSLHLPSLSSLPPPPLLLFLPLSPLPSPLSLPLPLSPSQYAKGFYIGQWLHDNQTELEKILQSASSSSPSHAHSFPDMGGAEEDEYGQLDTTGKAVHQAEKIKDFLLNLMKPMSTSVIR